jgi:predicted enzyme related to lactoylglutathione lyase
MEDDMQKPLLNWVLLYVDNTQKSAAFYTRLLGQPPVDAPGDPDAFVMYALPTGWMLGLWHKGEVEPPANPVGGSEVSFTEPSDAAVQQRHDEWVAAGIRIAQSPTRMDFGMTFTALDPDGHRLRVFAPPASPA